MNTLNRFSAALILVSFFMFITVNIYHQRTVDNQLKYSKIIASITSTLTPNPERTDPSFTSKGYVLTEERGILITMLFSVVLLCIAVVLNYIGQHKFGKNRVHLPLSFSAVLIAIMILTTIKNVGLLNYA